MNAWDTLVANSTAPNGSVAWVHLNNQSGGSGDIFIFGQEEVFIMADLEAEIILEAEKVALDDELNAIIEEELYVEVCTDGN